MKVFFALMLVLLTSGCAALTGGRHYDASTEVRPDGSKKCTFSIDSNSVLTGVAFKACDGAFEAQATNVQQGNSAADFNSLFVNMGKALTGQPLVEPAKPAATAAAPKQ